VSRQHGLHLEFVQLPIEVLALDFTCLVRSNSFAPGRMLSLRWRRVRCAVTYVSLMMIAAASAHAFAIGASPPIRVVTEVHRDVSPRLRDLKAVLPAHGDFETEEAADALSMRAVTHFAANHFQDPVAQRAPSTGAAAPLVRSFEGMGDGLSQQISTPPDANGDVGPHHYLQVTNGVFAVFAKSGVLLSGPTAEYLLWKGFDGLCGSQDQGDPVAVYDGVADRWIMSHMAWGATEGRQCIVVSQTADPLGAWYRYEFSFPAHNDYSKLSVWPSAYILTTSQPSSLQVCALDREQMLLGAQASEQCFAPVIANAFPFAADVDGTRQPAPGTPAYVFTLSPFESTLGVFRLAIDWTVPSQSRISSRTPVSVAVWSTPCSAGLPCVQQSGTQQGLGTGGGGIMNRVTYRNFGDHEALLISHSVDVEGTIGIRWYELRPDSGGNLAMFQQGTFAPDSNHRWLGSAAMDKQGDVALGYSVSSAQLYPSIRYVGRLARDPLGIMSLAEGSIFEGSFAQTWGDRWGDYSALQVDPVDDCTFWYTTEHAGRSGPGTRIGAFRLPGCAPPDAFALDAQPANVKLAPGTQKTITITSSVVAGQPGPLDLRIDGLPPGVTASFSQATIAAGGAAQVTLVAAPSAAKAEGRPFSVEGTSSSSQAYAVGSVDVVPASSSGCASTNSPANAWVLAMAILAALRCRSRAAHA
jgi:hypothetical protein